MEPILTAIVEAVKYLWESILPFYVVNEYEHAIVLRNGIYERTVDSGLKWKWPFIDQVMKTNNTMMTMDTKPQSLTTADEQNIVIASVIKYKVVDPKIFLIKVEDAKDALSDLAQGKIKEIVITKTWEECKSIKDTEIKNKLSTEAEKWGIKVELITITDLAKVRSIRLIR